MARLSPCLWRRPCGCSSVWHLRRAAADPQRTRSGPAAEPCRALCGPKADPLCGIAQKAAVGNGMRPKGGDQQARLKRVERRGFRPTAPAGFLTGRPGLPRGPRAMEGVEGDTSGARHGGERAAVHAAGEQPRQRRRAQGNQPQRCVRRRRQGQQHRKGLRGGGGGHGPGLVGCAHGQRRRAQQQAMAAGSSSAAAGAHALAGNWEVRTVPWRRGF